MKFKAIIFDLDGTLLDSLGGIADAMNTLLKQKGYPLHSLERYRYMVGEGLKELVRRAMPGEWHREFPVGNRLETALEELVKEYRAVYEEKWPLQSPPYSGVPEMLEALDRLQIKRAILSNKLDDFAKRMTWTLLPNGDFDMVLGVRPGVPAKPDPAAALEIAGSMNLAPETMVFMGDSGVDMQTGVKAGMYPVGVLWGFRDADELLANGAKQLIRHPLDLVSLVA